MTSFDTKKNAVTMTKWEWEQDMMNRLQTRQEAIVERKAELQAELRAANREMQIINGMFDMFMTDAVTEPAKTVVYGVGHDPSGNQY